MLYLGNKTFYWFSDVDPKKFSSAKISWLVEDGYQLCISDYKIGGMQITPLTRILSVGGLVPQIFMFSRRRRGLKKRLRNTQWNPPSPRLKFACKMRIFLHFLQGIQTQKRLRTTGLTGRRGAAENPAQGMQQTSAGRSGVKETRKQDWRWEWWWEALRVLVTMN